MGLIGACGIVIAGPRSTFALTEARLGLAASVISLTVLPQLTSRAVGRYFLTGEKFAPAEAERLGIVTVAAEERGSLRGAAGRAAPKLSAGTGRIQSANHRSGPG